MTTVVNDTFTEQYDTALSSHTPNTGDSWTNRWTETGGLNYTVQSLNDAVIMYPEEESDSYGFVFATNSSMSDGYVQGNISAIAGVSRGYGKLLIRYQSSNYHYTITGQSSYIYVYRESTSATTQLASLNISNAKWVRLQATGSSPTSLKAEARTTQGALGTGWNVTETTDNTTGYGDQSSGWVGIGAEFDTSYTGGGYNYEYSDGIDDFLAETVSGGGPTTTNKHSQAQADVKTSYTRYSQAQAHLKTAYRGYSQVNAQITKAAVSYTYYAQAQAKIKASYRGYSQTQTRVKNYSLSYGQTQANIKTTYRGYSQARSQIQKIGQGFSQAQAHLKGIGQGYSQVQTTIRRNSVTTYAQAFARIKKTYPAGGGGGTVAQDTFTEAGTGTANLTTHTPETGTWTSLYSDNGRTWLIDKDNDRAKVATTVADAAWGQVLYGIASMTDGYAQANLVASAHEIESYLLLRTSSNGLYAYGVAGGLLYKIEGTSYTQIGTVGGSGNWYRFYASGSSPTTLKVERRTTEGALGTGWLLETSDNTANLQRSSGYVAILGQWDNDYNEVSHDIDNLLATQDGGGSVEGPTFAQAQAQIGNAVTQRNGFGQVQARVKNADRVYSQAQADIKTTYRSYSQAQTLVSKSSSVVAQSNAYIKANVRGYSQASVIVRQSYRGYGQSGAQVTKGQERQVYGQGNALLGVTTDLYSAIDETTPSDSDWITPKQVGTSYTAKIKLSTVWTPLWKIDHILRWRSDTLGQNVLTLKLYEGTTLIATATQQATTGFTTTEYRLTSGEMTAITNYANLYVEISCTNRFYLSWVELQVPEGTPAKQAYAQVQTRIKNAVVAHGQTQAHIRNTYRGYAQASTKIVQSYRGYSQATAKILLVQKAYAQSAASISGGVSSDLYQFIDEVSPSDTDYIYSTSNPTALKYVALITDLYEPTYRNLTHYIRVRAYKVGANTATLTVDLVHNGATIATRSQGLDTNVTTYAFTLLESETNLLTDYANLQLSFSATAGASTQIYVTWTEIEIPSGTQKIRRPSAQAMASILEFAMPTVKSQVMARIKNYGQQYGQALAEIKQVRFVGHAQAGAFLNSKYRPHHGQAQAKLRKYGERMYAQAGALIARYKFAQAQARVKNAMRNSGQAQARITNAKGNAFGQTLAWIDAAKTNVHAQALAEIRFIGGFGQAQAILNMAFQLAQVATHIKTPNIVVYGGAIANIKVPSQAYAQASFYIIKGIRVAQAQAKIRSRGWGYAQALAKIGHQAYAQAQAYVRVYVFMIKYGPYILPGYAQSESITSGMKIQSSYSSYGSFTEYQGLDNKVLSLQMRVWDESGYYSAKEQIQLASTMLRSRKDWTNLYVGNPDRHYSVLVQSIRMEQTAQQSGKIIDYDIEFEAKPWLISDWTRTATGTGTITITRTLDNGGWTPATIRISGTNVTLSGYTSTDFTGFISISGAVSNMLITQEPFTVTLNNSNAIRYIKNPVDAGLYIGPGTTYISVTGASSCEITYNDRWYI